MGIVGALVFVAWFISGIVFAFRAMPAFTSAERLSHLIPLDLSTARVEPMDAARNLEIQPTRLRVGMYYDGRPVYRFQGNSIVYADTGEQVPGRDANQALEFVRWLKPDHAATIRYDSLMTESDLWTAAGAPRQQRPLHKIALGDSQDTYYYISQAVLGILGAGTASVLLHASTPEQWFVGPGHLLECASWKHHVPDGTRRRDLALLAGRKVSTEARAVAYAVFAA
jgi:hypothetical protein